MNVGVKYNLLLVILVSLRGQSEDNEVTVTLKSVLLPRLLDEVSWWAQKLAPSPVISGVITPLIIRVITPVTHSKRPFIRVLTPFITSRGPPCRVDINPLVWECVWC